MRKEEGTQIHGEKRAGERDNITPVTDIKWGKMVSSTQVEGKLNDIYAEIITWRKNLFNLPRGKVGNDFITELARLINLFSSESRWGELSLKLVHVFMPLMLQKPAKNSSGPIKAKYLRERLTRWKNGEIDEIFAQCKETQKRLKSNDEFNRCRREREFCRYMLMGKVRKAMQFINNDGDVVGVLPANEEIYSELLGKHPQSRGISQEAKLPETGIKVEPIIFKKINANVIRKIAKNMSGSGGPTQVDADTWRHIICSKFYKNSSVELANSIANMAKKLATKEVKPHITDCLFAGRLIPLEKRPSGIRPIGIGEVLRRIISKAITQSIRGDITAASGALQTCSGVEGGIEAAIHAMKKSFDNESCEAMLLVDASNAFNNLNRITALHNIKQICPPFYMFLKNTYEHQSRLFLSGTGDIILSQEGTTQGDPAAMAMYALGIRPLMDKLASRLDEVSKHAWYADDSSACGSLKGILSWWSTLKEEGPKYGYYPNSRKTVLILKDAGKMQEARDRFDPEGIEISLEGERHLGAAIGSQSFKENYVGEKVKKWVDDVSDLAKIAEEEPQLAYAAFTKGLAHRWKFVQRTIKDIGPLFESLEEAIRDKFLPAVLGSSISNEMRRKAALPLRWGGIANQNPVGTSDIEYEASVKITKELTDKIYAQNNDLSGLNYSRTKRVKADMKKEKEERFENEYDDIVESASDQEKRSMELAKERNSYCWLSSLPIESLGFTINKKQFQDEIRRRLNLPLIGLQAYCGGCGSENSVDHALSCETGGYVTFRHNVICETEADFLREICYDVGLEPQLIPTQADFIRRSTAREDGVKVDIVSTGLFGMNENDVRETL